MYADVDACSDTHILHRPASCHAAAVSATNRARSSHPDSVLDAHAAEVHTRAIIMAPEHMCRHRSSGDLASRSVHAHACQATRKRVFSLLLGAPAVCCAGNCTLRARLRGPLAELSYRARGITRLCTRLDIADYRTVCAWQSVAAAVAVGAIYVYRNSPGVLATILSSIAIASAAAVRADTAARHVRVLQAQHQIPLSQSYACSAVSAGRGAAVALWSDSGCGTPPKPDRQRGRRHEG